MKRNNVLFFSVIVAFGLGLTQLPNVLAQEMGSSTNKIVEEKPPAEAEARMVDALKVPFPGAEIVTFKKTKTVGTNDIYAVELTDSGKALHASVATEGTVMETDEPADIKTFPQAANDALRKAITGVGVKDNGVRLGKTYAEVQKDESGQLAIVKLPAPVLIYRADVQNNHGTPGRFGFKADGTPVEKPDWAQ
jgi:hypothetical protein